VALGLATSHERISDKSVRKSLSFCNRSDRLIDAHQQRLDIRCLVQTFPLDWTSNIILTRQAVHLELDLSHRRLQKGFLRTTKSQVAHSAKTSSDSSGRFRQPPSCSLLALSTYASFE
jgi:hypothetical protein